MSDAKTLLEEIRDEIRDRVSQPTFVKFEQACELIGAPEKITAEDRAAGYLTRDEILAHIGALNEWARIRYPDTESKPTTEVA